MSGIDIPHCHYCERIAPDYRFEGIAVCSKCIQRLTGYCEWVLYLTPSGNYTSTPVINPTDLSDWKFIARGSFDEIADLSSTLEGSWDKPPPTD